MQPTLHQAVPAGGVEGWVHFAGSQVVHLHDTRDKDPKGGQAGPWAAALLTVQGHKGNWCIWRAPFAPSQWEWSALSRTDR